MPLVYQRRFKDHFQLFIRVIFSLKLTCALAIPFHSVLEVKPQSTALLVTLNVHELRIKFEPVQLLWLSIRFSSTTTTLCDTFAMRLEKVYVVLVELANDFCLDIFERLERNLVDFERLQVINNLWNFETPCLKRMGLGIYLFSKQHRIIFINFIWTRLGAKPWEGHVSRLANGGLIVALRRSSLFKSYGLLHLFELRVHVNRIRRTLWQLQSQCGRGASW